MLVLLGDFGVATPYWNLLEILEYTGSFFILSGIIYNWDTAVFQHWNLLNFFVLILNFTFVL